MRPILGFFGVLMLLALPAPLIQAAEPDGSASWKFEPQTDFVKLPDGMTLGSCSAVSINEQGEIFLFHRGKHPILCLDAAGKLLRSWGDDEIQTAHGLRIDRDGNLWATDMGAHRVLKFSPRGKLLLALGTGKAGTGDDQFDRPTDVAFGAGGEVYVSDGYGNSRVLKFTPEGRLIKSWGKLGKAPGEFRLPHSILVDTRGRILVGDRENDRIQLFDEEGKLLEIWDGFAPYGMTFDHAGTLFVADARAQKILRLDARGRVQQSWGGKGTAPGEFDLPHMLAFDAAGNLFVAEVAGKRLQKLVRQKP
jgi:sugar lactone lactonase YvrE